MILASLSSIVLPSIGDCHWMTDCEGGLTGARSNWCCSFRNNRRSHYRSYRSNILLCSDRIILFNNRSRRSVCLFRCCLLSNGWYFSSLCHCLSLSLILCKYLLILYFCCCSCRLCSMNCSYRIR